MFRRRRLVAGSLVAVIVVSLVAGVARLLGGSTVGVVDQAVPASSPAATSAATAHSGSVQDIAYSTAAAAGLSLATARVTPKPTGPASVKPAGPDPMTVVPTGSGKFTAFAVPDADTAGRGRVVTYTVEMEQGLHADGRALAAAVQAVLKSPKGWQRADSVRFVHLDQAQVKHGKKPDVIVTFASPGTVDKLCAPLKTAGRTSCASSGRAVLNYWRWVSGVEYFGNDLTAYRQYMVNHEVGHVLGHSHVGCTAKGQPAPVMLQQTLGLDGCTPNAWPTIATTGKA